MGARRFLMFLAFLSIIEILRIASSICTEAV
jgi:hypothetical protein